MTDAAHAWQLRKHAPAPGTRLCKLSDIDDGTGREFTFGPDKDAFRMFVVRRGEAAYGYLNICPHFSLPLNYRPGQFTTADGDLIMCSMHLALFRFEDGLCIEGACPGRSLDPVPIVIDEGQVSIDPG